MVNNVPVLDLTLMYYNQLEANSDEKNKDFNQPTQLDTETSTSLPLLPGIVNNYKTGHIVMEKFLKLLAICLWISRNQ